MEVFIALLCVAVVLWLAWRWKQTSVFKKLGIPGPEPNLIFGNILELYEKGPIKCHEEWVKKYGRVLGYYYGMKPVLLITDPYLLKDIFIKDFNKFINRETFSPIHRYNPKNPHSQSVLNLPGQAWKDVRSILTPTFTVAKMKQMAGSINSSVDNMLDVLQARAQKGEEFEIFDTYQRLTMDVITKTAFGIQTNVQKDPKSSLLRATKLFFVTNYKDPIVLVAFVTGQVSQPVQLIQRWFAIPGLAESILAKRLCIRLQEFIAMLMNNGKFPHKMLVGGIKKVIQLRRTNPEAKKNDLLQLMLDSSIVVDATETDVSKLEAGNTEVEKLEAEKKETTDKKIRKMTEAEIQASAFVVLLAGYETTSTALAFTTYLLSKHQAVQENLYQEIKELIERGQKLEYASINKLPYLDKVLNESLRMYPPVHLFTNRFAVEDAQYGDIQIPKGTLIQAPVHLMHHDPEFWPEPEIFDPERFNTKPNANGVTYLPFGVGPRNCLGMRFAQLEAKLAVAHIISKFRLKLGERHKDRFLVTNRIRTLSPQEGVYVKLEPRSEDT